MGDQVDMFMGVTGTDEETARQILDVSTSLLLVKACVMAESIFGSCSL